MAWLWDSWKEYVDAVHPAVCKSSGLWQQSHRDSSFTVQCRLWDMARKLEEAWRALDSLGFHGNEHKRSPQDSSILSKAKRIVLETIYSGEALLLYNKRLAISDASYGFLHQNDLLEHWDRYEGSDRIFEEIDQLVSDIGELLEGYRGLVE